MATLVRWDTAQWTPLRELVAMQGEVSRLMNGLFEGSNRSAEAWVPALDAWETERELVFAFDLPGVSQDAIEVEVDDGALTVSAERTRTEEVSDEYAHRLERRHGTFTRTVGLPQGISGDAVRAKFADGVLEIRVPKPEQPKPRRIKVGVESAPPTIEGTVSGHSSADGEAGDLGAGSAA